MCLEAGIYWMGVWLWFTMAFLQKYLVRSSFCLNTCLHKQSTEFGQQNHILIFFSRFFFNVCSNKSLINLSSLALKVADQKPSAAPGLCGCGGRRMCRDQPRLLHWHRLGKTK